jgi:DNA invertase Pin-like site-specific DNA recombinase
MIEQITRAGAAFRSLGDPLWDTSNPQGRLLARIAEFERELFRERTEDGSKRVMARGVTYGRKLNLSQYQREDAIRRRAAGATLTAIAASYGVHVSMISRLRLRRPRGCPGVHPAVRGVIRLAMPAKPPAPREPADCRRWKRRFPSS